MLTKEYRDRIYIRKDILLKLYETGEMNQSRLLSACGLNNAKHKEILEDMAEKGFLNYRIEQEKNQSVLKYSISEKGTEILKEVFERYELLFPRGEKNAK